MMNARTRNRRRLATITGVVCGAMLALTACSSSSDSPDDTPVSPTSEATPEAETTTDPDEAAEPEVVALYEAYWDALITVNNDMSADVAVFNGIVPAELVEGVMAGVNTNARNGMHRTGEPEITGVTATVDGDTAEVQACIDQRPWQFVQGEGEPFTVETPPSPQGVRMTRTDGAWMITEFFEEADATISC